MESLASQVWSIALPGKGRLYPQERNFKDVRCRICQKPTVTGSAIKFIASRGGNIPGGYVCIVCVAEILQGRRWTFNPVLERLIPARAYMENAISGQRLADLFTIDGERGLFAAVTENQSQPSTVGPQISKSA